MNFNRRSLTSTAALSAAALALAACSAGSAATSASVEQVIAQVQGLISYLGPTVPLIAAFVPGAAPFIPVMEEALTTAGGLLDTLSATMSAAQAQPVVTQVLAALDGALTAAGQAAALVKNPQQHAMVEQLLAEARVIFGLLSTFVLGTAAAVMPTAARRSARHVHVRVVK